MSGPGDNIDGLNGVVDVATVDKNKKNTSDGVKKDLRTESPEPRPLERQVEARGSTSEDGLGSMVRCLHFAHTYIANPMTMSATLWAGKQLLQIPIDLDPIGHIL